MKGLRREEQATTSILNEALMLNLMSPSHKLTKSPHIKRKTKIFYNTCGILFWVNLGVKNLSHLSLFR